MDVEVTYGCGSDERESDVCCEKPPKDVEWVFHFALKVLFTDANGGGCHALSGDCVMISFLGAEAFAVYWNWNNPKRYYF